MVTNNARTSNHMIHNISVVPVSCFSCFIINTIIQRGDAVAAHAEFC